MAAAVARRGPRAVWLLALAVVCVPLAAAGHLRFPKLAAERWIEFRLDETPMRIGYRIGLGATLAQQARRGADLDGDAEVSAAEGNRALDQHSARLLASLRVCEGRSLDQLTCRSFRSDEVERVEADGWKPSPAGHLHFAWTLRLRHSADEVGAVRLIDDFEVPGVAITDVEIRRPRHTALVAAGEGEHPVGVSTQLVLLEARRSPGPRVLSASWPAPPSTNWRGVAALAALVLALAAAASWHRRRRAQR